MDGARSRSPGSRHWYLDQWLLAAAGAVAFVLGVSVHRDRGNLAVTLVGVGVLLLILAAFLPRIQTLSGKIGGVELAVGLIPPPAVTTDHNLATASMPGLAPTDLRNAGAPPSGPAGFAEAIKGGPADLVIINLEAGRAWLTSRLFIFVTALIELRGIDAVVFTHRPRDVDVVVGIAPACAVLERLASAFPWLPSELGATWDQIRYQGEGPARDRLSLTDADMLYTFYVARLSRPGLPSDRVEQWVNLDGGRRERALWIDPALVRRLLGSDLSEVSVREQTPAVSPIGDPPERAALAFTGVRFVPVVSDRHEFRTVVDRFALLDALWNRRAL